MAHAVRPRGPVALRRPGGRVPPPKPVLPRILPGDAGRPTAPVPRWLRRRYWVTVALVVITFGTLLVRLAQMQLVDTAAYAAEARGNAIKPEAVLPPRGRMYDRNGRVLVANEATFRVAVTPYLFDAARTAELARLLGLPDSTLSARLDAARRYNPYAASLIARWLTTPEVARVAEQLYRLPGVSAVEGQRRTYPSAVPAPFAFGTLGEVGPEELRQRRAARQDYHLGDVVGVSGMEKAYEEALRGRPGTAFVEVDIHGRRRGAWKNGARDVPAVAGFDLTLTLDAALQAFADSLFVNKRGAAVALDPRNGEVLAYVSAPAFASADLAPPIDTAAWRRLNADPVRPLFDRAALSAQPLGSTIKPFMALAGLETGTLDEGTTIGCGGAYVWGGHVFRDHGAHGRTGLQDAISRSCNVYFYTTMMRMSFSEWTAWGRRFGFGMPMPTDLPAVGRGLWPDSAYFDRTYGAWTRGYLVSLGIGQGDLGVTPLQMARYAAVLANGGTLVAPHFARELRNPETGQVVRPGLPRPQRLPIDPAHMETVREGMLMVVEQGTGRRSRIEGIPMAGKTGTAENPHGEDHALFIAFAPYDDPRIAIAVLVENAGFGSTSAAPIASLMVERYLTGRIAEGRRPLLEHVLTAARSRDVE